MPPYKGYRGDLRSRPPSSLYKTAANRALSAAALNFRPQSPANPAADGENVRDLLRGNLRWMPLLFHAYNCL